MIIEKVIWIVNNNKPKLINIIRSRCIKKLIIETIKTLFSTLFRGVEIKKSKFYFLFYLMIIAYY